MKNKVSLCINITDMNMPTLQIECLEKCIELGEEPSELKCLYGVGSFQTKCLDSTSQKHRGD